MIKRNNRSIHQQTIYQWFFRIFAAALLLFCMALIPAFVQAKSAFSDLQIEKRTQMLSSGTSKLSSTVTGMINISQSLLEDSRFVSLHYQAAEYDNIPVTTQRQLKSELDNLSMPLDMISHIALLLDESSVVTSYSVFFQNRLDYYPKFFQVDDLNYDQFSELLSDTNTGYTRACHIKTYTKEYDAIIFTTPWANSSHLYACLKVSDIKKAVIEKDNLNDCYYTITSMDDEILYSDLPEHFSNYQTFSETCSSGNIRLSIHIPNSILNHDMQPFYIFLVVYIIACIILFVFVSLFGSQHATKPLMNIIEILEQSRNFKPTGTPALPQKSFANGFEYISNSIINAEQNLEKYQFALQAQQKLLQARFLEKALNGQIASKQDIQNFRTYFPEFPGKYYLLLIKLWTYTNTPDSTLYTEPLLLLQTFLEAECCNAYQHQISDTELLLLLSKEDYANYNGTITFMLRNINEEEPIYHASCIASDLCHTIDDLPVAYQQIIAMAGLSFPDYQTHICTASDYIAESKLPVTITDLMSLYTAITSGNLELSMARLENYSDELSRQENVTYTKPVFDIIRSILVYIKLDYSQLLAEHHIPRYELGKTLYDQLSQTINIFCRLICEYNNINKDSFTQELFNYIDTHYTDSDICLTSLKTHFKCSESTIRKVFKRVTDVPIARYIEQKRMILANELLAQNEKSVTEIALECGYILPHSFYKAYKRVYGHAPTSTTNASYEEDSE